MTIHRFTPGAYFIILSMIILTGCQPKHYPLTILNSNEGMKAPTLCLGDNGECKNTTRHIRSLYIADVTESGNTLSILWEIQSDSKSSELNKFIYGIAPKGYFEETQAYPLETGVVYTICGINYFMIVDGTNSAKMLYAETASELYALEPSKIALYYSLGIEYKDSIESMQAHETYEELSYNNCYINGLHSILYSKLTWRIIDTNKFLAQMGTEKRGLDRINMYASSALQAANTYACEDLFANRDALKTKFISILDGIRLEERFGVEIIEVELTVPPSSWD